MKKRRRWWFYLLILTTFIGVNDLLSNIELDAAYKREYIFLISQKKSLLKQKQTLLTNYQKALGKAKNELSVAQKKLVSLSTHNESKETELFHLEQSQSNAEENKTLFLNTIKQVAYELKEESVGEKDLASLFDKALESIRQGSKNRLEQGASFFLKNGEMVQGDIFYLGQISSFGHYKRNYYILAPAGKGEFKAWRKESVVGAYFKGQVPPMTPLFIYEDSDRGVEQRKEQTLFQFISDGGMIAWTIVAMGFLVAILCVLRVMRLRSYSRETKFIEQISQGADLKDHLVGSGAMSSQKSFFARLLDNEDRAAIDDVIDEGVMHEHKIIDRFGAMILVCAAVAPLFGLLGTVTGMISTFSVITEHGTGDPKLLSHGISEALITTQLGLVVAIPSLFLGNLLSAWGKNIKMTLSKVALRVANEF